MGFSRCCDISPMRLMIESSAACTSPMPLSNLEARVRRSFAAGKTLNQRNCCDGGIKNMSALKESALLFQA